MRSISARTRASASAPPAQMTASYAACSQCLCSGTLHARPPVVRSSLFSHGAGLVLRFARRRIASPCGAARTCASCSAVSIAAILCLGGKGGSCGPRGAECATKRERERERELCCEKEKERDRERQRETERQRQRQRHTHHRGTQRRKKNALSALRSGRDKHARLLREIWTLLEKRAVGRRVAGVATGDGHRRSAAAAATRRARDTGQRHGRARGGRRAQRERRGRRRCVE